MFSDLCFLLEQIPLPSIWESGLQYLGIWLQFGVETAGQRPGIGESPHDLGCWYHDPH